MHDERGSLDVPDDLVATIGFTPGGRVFGNDTVNGMSGRFSLTRTGYVVRDVGSTLVAYVGSDPQRARTITAVDAMFFRLKSSAPLIVAASLSGHTLTLAQGGTTLKLRELGAEHDAPAPSATSTR